MAKVVRDKLNEVEEGAKAGAEGGGAQGGTDGVGHTPEVDGAPEKPKWDRRIPLSVPPGRPGRLVEMENKILAAVRRVFDDVEAIDISIDKAAEAVGELMSSRVSKVGVDWQKHRRREGKHPVVYRTARGGMGGARVQVGRKTGSEGVSDGFARRFWVEPVNHPMRLAKLAQYVDRQLMKRYKDGAAGMRPDEVASIEEQLRIEARIRSRQQEALAKLQELVEHRDSALKPLSTLMRSLGMWRSHHWTVTGALVDPIDTEQIIAKSVALRRWLVTAEMARQRAARDAIEMNEEDDRQREDGPPR